jgi:Ca2+-binding EF-hand superfamily protein
MSDVTDRIAARVAELGRKLTPQELIEVINEPDEDSDRELTYEPDPENENE